MASTYLTCNVGSPNQQRFTWSLWVKRSKLGVEQHLAGNNADGNNRTHLFITNTEKLYFFSSLSGSNIIAYQTNRLFRDLNAWYHIVCAVDTTQAGGNRIRIYVNGEEETSFATETECNQNTNLSINGTHYIGTYGGDAGGASYTFDGSISHLHFVDGLQLTPSSFGSTDSTTGEWKINTSPSVTYGSSGYFILKDGNSVTDQSGNSNNFTVAGGTLTKTEDCPSNVFATWNPLVNPWSGATTWTYGNTRAYNSDSSKGSVVTTLGATSGKYYMEVKQENANGVWIGVCGDGFVSDNLLNSYSGQTQDATTGLLIKYSDGTRAVNNTDTNSVFATTGSGDITGIALDLDATTKTVTFYKNGVADSAGSQNLPTNMQTGAVFGCAIVFSGSAVNLNAGNGYFANNAISSEGTNASGIGKFEYDVPANHTALSTKGLNE